MTTAYHKTELSGGGVNALDGISGGSLSDGDFASVAEAGVFYFYLLDVDSAETASIPAIIAPTVNPGDKRWILQSVGGASIGTTTTATDDISIAAVPYDVIKYIDPNGANRNIILTGVWEQSVQIKIFNIGSDYNLLFNSTDSIFPGSAGIFGFDGTTWRRWV